jgi:hypothetical protein
VVRVSIQGRWLERLVGAADEALRRLYGITEFESEREGLLRIERCRAECGFTLSDGTRVHRGDTVIELHLWNEHLPPVPEPGADFAWAVQVRRQALLSLHRLAVHICANRRLDGVCALRMQPAIARRKPVGALARLLLRSGFEPIVGATRVHGRVLRLLDSAWLWLLTWMHNPSALRGRHFDRSRHDFWISRQSFLRRYADRVPQTVDKPRR